MTKQGHPVPKTAHSPKGPFPPELTKEPEIVTDYVPFDEDVPIGGTAQNNFVEPKIFKCRLCNQFLYENKIPDHICGGNVNGEDA